MPHAEAVKETGVFTENHIVIDLNDPRDFNFEDFVADVRRIGTDNNGANMVKFVVSGLGKMYVFRDFSDPQRSAETKRMNHFNVSKSLGIVDNLVCAGKILEYEGLLSLSVGSVSLEVEGKLVNEQSNLFADEILKPKLGEYIRFVS